jgi:hypothetical protein
LLQPLGAWTKDPLLTCNWAFNPTTTKAYKRTTAGWVVYNPRGRSRARTGGTFQATNICIPTLPHNTRVATLYTHQKQPSLATLQSFSQHPVQRLPTTSSPTNLEEAIKGLPPDTKWAVETLALGPTTTNQQGANVAAAILQGTCKAVTDGSYKDSHGTASFIIQGNNRQHSIKGSNVTHGSPAEQCAYGSELGGILGILVMLEMIQEQFQLDSGKATIGCDCERAITKLTTRKKPAPADSHYDLLVECRARIKSLQITVDFKWVEGHQDSKNQGHALALDWWALQNIAMDRQARRHWRQTRHQTPPNIMFSQETYAILVAGSKLSSFKKQLVHATTNERPIREYWQVNRASQMLLSTTSIGKQLKLLRGLLLWGAAGGRPST